MEWHEEFKAYARAFGRDEVAAILLRDGEREWITWPAQKVEGLTFTLTSDAILDSVPADDLQHVVGWIHSHPMGLDPSPSGTDDGQIRELAKDLAGQVAEMWIFGGHDYRQYSITRGVHVNGQTFTSDTEHWQQGVTSTPWDEAAEKFYNESRPPVPLRQLLPTYSRSATSPTGTYGWASWDDEDDEDIGRESLMAELDQLDQDGYLPPTYGCVFCGRDEADYPDSLCNECDAEAKIY